MHSTRAAPRADRAPGRLFILPVIALVLCAMVIQTSSRIQAADAFAPAAGRRPTLQDSELTAALDAIKRGRYDDARRALEAMAARDPRGEAALELGLLHVRLGRRDAAVATLEPILERVGRDAPALVRAGRAAHALGYFQEANGYFRQAAAITPDDPVLNTAWGELFLEKYNRQDASQSFQSALRADPGSVQARLGLARAMADDNPPAALAAANRALEADPSYPPAHVFVASLHLDQGHRDEARQALDRALATNPSSLEARALVGAMAYLDGREADFEAEVAAALAINPRYGEVYRVAAEQAARNYRFAEAVTLTERALALDPDNVRARADLGMHLLRTGDEAAARQTLERAFKADPFDVVTYNLLGLLDTLDGFVTITEGDLEIKLHPDEAEVMKEYVVPLARRALSSLSARYQFRPQGPILIEMFPRHDDFAVRNLGLPGMIGALGACFGRVVTIDSPRARPPGTFNWGATLWHEIAHVITLQMSNQRVPRWLTEGVSVYEEKRARPDWGREMEVTFAAHLEHGEVLKLRDLNAGFTNPETISLAYYQASLLVEHLVETYGEPALHKLLRAFATGIDTEQALEQELDVDFDRLQVTFDQAIERQFGALRRALRAPAELSGASLDKLKSVAAGEAGSYPVQIALGRALARSGDLDGALAAFERAAHLVPMATGPESPRALMAEIALKRDDKARAIEELEALLAHDHTDIESARRLAGLLDADRHPDRAAAAYERIVAIDPFDPQAHGVLGRLALARQDFEAASREFRVALAIGPADPAAAHCDLAESYLLGGQIDAARRQALAALEIAPAYERAQELLLKISEGGS